MSAINDALSSYATRSARLAALQAEALRIDRESSGLIEELSDIEITLMPFLEALGETTVIHRGYGTDGVLLWNAEENGLEWVAAKHMFSTFVDPNDDEAEDDQ